jgi:hypothetical protein
MLAMLKKPQKNRISETGRLEQARENHALGVKITLSDTACSTSLRCWYAQIQSGNLQCL